MMQALEYLTYNVILFGSIYLFSKWIESAVWEMIESSTKDENESENEE
jgi:hypothetical protein